MWTRLAGRVGFLLTVACWWACLAAPAVAHFVWVETKREGDELLVRAGFGEFAGWDADLADRMKLAQFWTRSPGGLAPVSLPWDATKMEYWSHVVPGLSSAIVATDDFGVVKLGSKPATWLRYTAKSLIGAPANWHDTQPTATLRIELLAVPAGEQVQLQLMHLGKPLVGAIVKAYSPQDQRIELTTDEQGRANWPITGAGLYGCYVGTTIETPGEHDGQAFETMKDYTTLTFRWRAGD